MFVASVSSRMNVRKAPSFKLGAMTRKTVSTGFTLGDAIQPTYEGQPHETQTMQ